MPRQNILNAVEVCTNIHFLTFFFSTFANFGKRNQRNKENLSITKNQQEMEKEVLEWKSGRLSHYPAEQPGANRFLLCFHFLNSKMTSNQRTDLEKTCPLTV